MSKASYKKSVRRKVRREENAFDADAVPSRDKTLGRACRRGYGAGKAKT